MLGEAWRTLLKKHIAYDIPDEMAACFDCDTVRCPDAKYSACPVRLAQVQAANEFAPHATADR
jgi:hypothetical protein